MSGVGEKIKQLTTTVGGVAVLAVAVICFNIIASKIFKDPLKFISNVSKGFL